MQVRGETRVRGVCVSSSARRQPLQVGYGGLGAHDPVSFSSLDRLRVSLSAAHSMRDLDELADAIKRCSCRLQRLPALDREMLDRERRLMLRGTSNTMHGSRL